LSRAKFRGYELPSNEIARLWNGIRADASGLGYDVGSFAMPNMRVFYDVPQKDFLKLFTAHCNTGDAPEKHATEPAEGIAFGGVITFTHAHFDKPTCIFTLVLIFVRKGAGHFTAFDRLIRHELAQLFEVLLGLETGTLVNSLNLGHEHH
jgi:hypothetical protein